MYHNFKYNLRILSQWPTEKLTFYLKDHITANLNGCYSWSVTLNNIVFEKILI